MTDIAEALKDLDMKSAMRTAFGKCPECAKPLSHGLWLRWCKKCNVVLPITKTQRLDVDSSLRGSDATG